MYNIALIARNEKRILECIQNTIENILTSVEMWVIMKAQNNFAFEHTRLFFIMSNAAGTKSASGLFISRRKG